MRVSITKEHGAVIIDGILPLRFHAGRDNQFIAACWAILQARGTAIPYEELMGLSGAAFRLHFWVPDWCPSSPDLLGGFSHLPPLADALGLAFTDQACYDANDVERADLRRAIRASIDGGWPVIGNSLEGRGRYGVIGGYQQDEDACWCCTYDDATDAYTKTENWPWRLVFLRDGKAPLPRRQALLRSLRLAVELADTPVYQRDGAQASGMAAYEWWISRLLDADELAARTPEDLEYAAYTNGWIFLALTDARHAAAAYLANIATEFAPAMATLLRRAAEIYREMAIILDRGWPHVCWRQTAQTPPAPWTAEMREGQAQVLREALRLEREAVLVMKQVLKSAGERIK